MENIFNNYDNGFLDLIPFRFFRNPSSKFLDPLLSSPSILMDIAIKLYNELPSVVHSEGGVDYNLSIAGDRINHIIKNMIYGIANDKKIAALTINYFNNIVRQEDLNKKYGDVKLLKFDALNYRDVYEDDDNDIDELKVNYHSSGLGSEFLDREAYLATIEMSRVNENGKVNIYYDDSDCKVDFSFNNLPFLNKTYNKSINEIKVGKIKFNVVVCDINAIQKKSYFININELCAKFFINSILNIRADYAAISKLDEGQYDYKSLTYEFRKSILDSINDHYKNIGYGRFKNDSIESNIKFSYRLSWLMCGLIEQREKNSEYGDILLFEINSNIKGKRLDMMRDNCMLKTLSFENEILGLYEKTSDPIYANSIKRNIKENFICYKSDNKLEFDKSFISDEYIKHSKDRYIYGLLDDFNEISKFENIDYIPIDLFKRITNCRNIISDIYKNVTLKDLQPNDWFFLGEFERFSNSRFGEFVEYKLDLIDSNEITLTKWLSFVKLDMDSRIIIEEKYCNARFDNKIYSGVEDESTEFLDSSEEEEEEEDEFDLIAFLESSGEDENDEDEDDDLTALLGSIDEDENDEDEGEDDLDALLMEDDYEDELNEILGLSDKDDLSVLIKEEDALESILVEIDDSDERRKLLIRLNLNKLESNYLYYLTKRADQDTKYSDDLILIKNIINKLSRRKKLSEIIGRDISIDDLESNFMKYNNLKMIATNIDSCSPYIFQSSFGDVLLGPLRPNSIDFKSLDSYFKSRFFRFLVLLFSIETNNSGEKPDEVFKLIPMIRLNKIWDDKSVYRSFNLSEKEISLIDSFFNGSRNSNGYLIKKRNNSK